MGSNPSYCYCQFRNCFSAALLLMQARHSISDQSHRFPVDHLGLPAEPALRRLVQESRLLQQHYPRPLHTAGLLEPEHGHHHQEEKPGQ